MNFRGFIGTDACIRVQWDDAFIPWDHIEFKDMSADDAKDKATLQSLHLSGSPEWVQHMMIMSLKLIVVFAILFPSVVPAQSQSMTSWKVLEALQVMHTHSASHSSEHGFCRKYLQASLCGLFASSVWSI
ncbi:hypothetical protein BDR06DRAFT_1014432 [Suillus hirtellus]|nr:hypothetical protein BDR06DRAFT_1014432 [Suillus hirtellus]